MSSENCPICGIKATQFCSACKSVKYCGVEHQKKHWKIHKNECRPFSVSENNEIGRFLLANRNIKANTIIFNETPLIVGPKWYLTDREIQTPIVPCVGCFQPVKIGGSGNSCPKCSWPACSPNCPGLENPKLHDLECAILSLGPGPSNPNDLKSLLDYYRTDALIVLKCLMLQKMFPKKWSQLIDMQSHEEERIGSELYVDAENRIVSYLNSNYLERLQAFEKQSNKKVLMQNDMKTLHKICGIIETNYMLISLPNGLDLTGIFYTACMMEHSCLPNCYFTFDHNNGFKVSVIAGCDIKKGEHLKIMYSNMLWGTLLRQEHLQMTKHFTCNCQRCIDPTELGTYFSAMKCMGLDTNSCEGIQLPEDPLKQSSDWKCNKCAVKISGEEVRYVLTQMGEEVDNLLNKKPTIDDLENLMEKLSQFVHKNHYHLFNLKHSLVQLYGKQDSSDGILLQKLDLCDELLNICNTLDPHTIRLSLYVATLLYEKHVAIIKLNKKFLENVTTGNDKNDDGLNEDDTSSESSLKIKQARYNEAVENIKFTRALLLKANEILRKELDTVGGMKLSETVTKSISQIDTLIANNS